MFIFISFCSSANDICPCEVHNGRNPGCCCSGLHDRSEYPPGCYPSFPASILPVCPAKHWRREGMSLHTFLSEELFCISNDNRDVTNGRATYSFNEVNSSKYIPKYSNEVNEDAEKMKYSAGSVIRKNDSKFLLLPTSGASVDCSETLPIRFLESVKGKQCVTKTGVSISKYQDLKIPAVPGTEVFAPVSFIDDSTGTKLQTAPAENVKELSLVVRYEPFENHSINELEFHYKKDDGIYPSTFTLNAMFIEKGSNFSWSRGEIGYAAGEPIIAARYENGKIKIDEDLDNNVLPIAVGLKCASALYKPLKFGRDTLGACGGAVGAYAQGENPLINKRINAFAKHSNPDPTKLDDWYLLNDLDFDGCSENSYFQYVFYTKKLGSPKRPLDMIEKVKLTCVPEEEDSFKVTAAFVEIPQNVERDIGQFPIWLAPLPNDTWAPFA